MSSKESLSAFYAAGKALGLVEIGAAADVSLADAPTISALQVAATEPRRG
jgi:hypothetical protein